MLTGQVSGRRGAPPTKRDLQREAHYQRNEFDNDLRNLPPLEGDRAW